MRLLIVDDEIIAADAMLENIPWRGYGIDEAIAVYNVRDAKRVIMEKRIDILLSDIEMPGENGIELIRWVTENYPEVECVFVTCHAKFEYAIEAIKLGCEDYILKPATDEELGKAIQNVVHKLNQKRENHILKEYGKKWLDDKMLNAEKYKETLNKTKVSGKEFVKKVIKYIMSNINECNLTVSEIADHFHVHPVYLNRTFKKEMDISISQFIINERMKLAVQLLRKADIPATIVAEQVGYTNYPHFYVMFKKYYGCSPSQYKESIQYIENNSTMAV